MSITKNEKIVTLENEFLKRTIDISNGICTKTYHIRPGGEKLDIMYPMFSFEESNPFEAAVVINGESYEAAPFSRDDQSNLWRREGAFSVEDVVLSDGKLGDCVTFIMKSRLEGMPEVELQIRYELPQNQPFLSKQIKVINRSTENITVGNMAVDTLRFFDRRFPLSVFTDYYCDVKKEDSYYFCWTRLEIPDEMGMQLHPNQEVSSFTAYEAVTSMDRQEESIILHRIYKELAPWINDLRIEICTNSCQSLEELYELADSASQEGCELVSLHVGQVFTNTGDYIPRPDLFPNGYDDVKKMVSYFHQKSIKILPYCSATIAWRDSRVCIEHEDWQCLGPDGLRYDPFGLGNMCYHSPWGEYIKEKLFYLIDDIGFDGLALDGPVHGLTCLETEHAHANEKSVNFMNWQWEKVFYSAVVQKGKLITAPESPNAIFMGVTEIPSGHREEDENEFGGMPLVVMKRACAYEARYSTPPCCHSFGASLEPYHGHSIEADEENTATYEHAVATGIGYGFNISAFGQRYYIGEKTKAVYKKWFGVFQEYRDTLSGDFIHVAQPNGYEPDGVLHTNSKAKTPALAVIFNPCNEHKTLAATLPLGFAGFKDGDTAIINSMKIKVDSKGGIAYNFELQPYEVIYVAITKE